MTVVNPQGFHARPAHLFVKLASQFQAHVEILKGNEVINGKSILDLLTLGAGNGTTLTLRADRPRRRGGGGALAKLIEGGFGEMPGRSASVTADCRLRRQLLSIAATCPTRSCPCQLDRLRFAEPSRPAPLGCRRGLDDGLRRVAAARRRR